jgi:membrane protein DedA with SNARE-associated domain/membrane-associated phospholipid phosphatase
MALGPGLIAGITDRILSLHGWAALAIVFAVPALEASAFAGFVFPGEIAVLLGGVLAFEHRISLPAAIIAAVAGAIIGDSVGYLIGRLWGRSLLRGTLGKLPLIRHRLDESLDRAQAYVKRRRGSAVFFGRFTAALRVLVPGLAGMSQIHFPTFLAYNAAGGILWGAGFVLLGYAAGASYRQVETIAGKIGLVLLGVIVIALALNALVRRSDRLRPLGDRLAATAAPAWVRRRFPQQVAWTRRRLEPGSPIGFWLTFTVSAGAMAAWAFGGLTQDVIGHDDVVRRDPRVESFVINHRTHALTAIMKVVTWFGSTAVLIPIGGALGGYVLLRRRDWRPGAMMAIVLAGALALYDIVKPAVGRARPPIGFWIGPSSGHSFPSGHATQSIAFYGMAALILGAGRAARVKTWLWVTAAAIVFLVGASRLYLGAHWLSDVLGGWALGATWLALVVAITLALAGSGRTRLKMGELTMRSGVGYPCPS